MKMQTDHRPGFGIPHPARGICPVCGDRVPLTDGDLIRVHLEPLNGVARWGRETCKGSGRAPARRDR